MIENDLKSGVSVPKPFKQKSTKAPSTFNPPVIVPATQEIAFATSLLSDSFFFELIAEKYAQNNMTVRRTDPRDGPVTYFVIHDGQAHKQSSLLLLYRIAREWENNHG